MKMTPAAMIAARRDAYSHAQESEEPPRRLGRAEREGATVRDDAHPNAEVCNRNRQINQAKYVPSAPPCTAHVFRRTMRFRATVCPGGGRTSPTVWAFSEQDKRRPVRCFEELQPLP